MLSKHEIDNLSKLLLSPLKESIQLGLEILSYQPDALKAVFKEFVILYCLNEDAEIKKPCKVFLNSLANKSEVGAAASKLRIFKFAHSYNDPGEKALLKYIRNYESVRSVYEPLILQNSNYIELFFYIGRRLLYNFESCLEKARLFFQVVIDYNPNHLKAQFNIAYLLHVCLNQRKEAIKHYEKTLEINPNYAGAYNNLGNIYSGFKDFKKAVFYYEKAIEHNPKNINAHGNLCGLYYFNLKEYEKCRPLIDKIFKLDKTNCRAFNTAASLAWEVDRDLAKAEEIYKKGITFHPEDECLVGNLGELYITEYKQYERGLTLYKQALGIKPNDDYRLLLMIELLRDHIKDYKQVKKYFQDLIKFYPNHLQYLVDYAEFALSHLKREDFALKLCKRALSHDPNFEPAKQFFSQRLTPTKPNNKIA